MKHVTQEELAEERALELANVVKDTMSDLKRKHYRGETSDYKKCIDYFNFYNDKRTLKLKSEFLSMLIKTVTKKYSYDEDNLIQLIEILEYAGEPYEDLCFSVAQKCENINTDDSWINAGDCFIKLKDYVRAIVDYKNALSVAEYNLCSVITKTIDAYKKLIECSTPIEKEKHINGYYDYCVSMMQDICSEDALDMAGIKEEGVKIKKLYGFNSAALEAYSFYTKVFMPVISDDVFNKEQKTVLESAFDKMNEICWRACCQMIFYLEYCQDLRDGNEDFCVLDKFRDGEFYSESQIEEAGYTVACAMEAINRIAQL